MAAKQLVLVVDDEPGTRRLIDLVLTDDGFRVISADNGMEAMRIAQLRPDLVVLDLDMAATNGADLMRRIRERTGAPVILLSSEPEADQQNESLHVADDYFVKPVNPRQLRARVRDVLHRAHHLPGDGRALRTDGIEIDLDSRQVRKDGAEVVLTRTEWRLLEELASHAGKVVFNEELLSRVWGPDYRDDLQYLRVWISRLRSKIEREPNHPVVIATFPGIGYMLKVGEIVAAGRRGR